MTLLRTCRDCGALKPLDEFSEEALRGRGHTWPRCLLCERDAHYVSQRVSLANQQRLAGAHLQEREVAREYGLTSGPPVDELERKVSAGGACKGDGRFRGAFHSKSLVQELRRICHHCPVREECELLGERFDQAFVTGTAIDTKTGRHLHVGCGFYAGRTPIERAARRDRRPVEVGVNRKRLVELLANGPKASHELAVELGVHPVSIKRMVRQLREEGVDIRSKQGGGGGYWLEDDQAA